MLRNSDQRKPSGRSVAYLAIFVLMFPGFFAYHWAVAEGVISPFLGGYTTAIAIAVFPYLAISYFEIVRKRSSRSLIDFAFLGFVFYLLVIVLWGGAFNANKEIVYSYFSVFVQWLSLFFFVRGVNADVLRSKVTFASSLAFMTATVLLNLDRGVFTLGSNDFYSGKNEVLATYQAYAVNYFIAVVFCILGVRRQYWRMLIYLTAFFILFVNGARSEFGVMFVFVLLLEWLLGKRARIGFLLSIMFVGGFLLLLLSAVDVFENSRVYDFIENGGATSRAGRDVFFDSALQTIANNPMFGEFAGYRPGEYSHNIFSVWVDFGLIGILWLLLLLLLPLIRMLRDWARWRMREMDGVAFAVLVSTVLLVFFAKSFTYLLIPFSLALCLATRRG